MLYLDYNSTIRDIFNQVEEISQHGLEELYDQEVTEGKRSYAARKYAARPARQAAERVRTGRQRWIELD